MAKKIMLIPSARSKFVKDQHMEILYKSLLLVAFVMVITNWYLFSFMHGIKLVLMVVLSIIVTREVEILFYQHDKDIEREESKELIKKSYPEVTALIYVLLIPLGTPLWLVMIGALLATLLGKLIFGGFHHMVFHSSLVGAVFVIFGWDIADTQDFTTSFDNNILKLLFDNSFFNETLSIGSAFDASSYVTSLEFMKTGNFYQYTDVLFGLVPGVLVSGLLLLAIGLYLMIKKYIDYIIPVSFIGSFLVTALIIGMVNDYTYLYPMFQLFSGSLLFVVLFAATCPITSPLDYKGKIIFGVIAGSLTMFIRNGSEYNEGVLFAVLFMQMLTPMFNMWFKPKKKKKPVKKVSVNE